jgi:hypothetical protein
MDTGKTGKEQPDAIRHVVSDDFEIPKFRATIPSHLMKDMDDHNKFLLEQISVIKNQNEWQGDVVHRIYNYTKTINGKVVELEKFRQNLLMELQLDEKWEDRQRENSKYKRWGVIIFLALLYPIYLAFIDHVGIGTVLEKIVGAGG